jgi:two-component system, OmpR family, response regulator TctD
MQNPPRRALVVDDEPTVHRLVSIALRRAGFVCDAAEDGLLAAALAVRRRYDVVVTDLRMPNKDGFALVADLLEMAERPVVVIYTGAADQDMARDFLARGADHFAFKPTDLALLAARIKSLVDRRAAQDGACRSADCIA